MTMQRFYGGQLEQLGEDEVAGIAISAGVKRDGDAWDPAGVDLSAYRRNPVVLFNHDPQLVIGTAAAIGLTPDGNSIAIRVQFAPPGSSGTADECRALAKCGALRGISAGIDPVEHKPLRNGTSGCLITKSELIEVSLVSTPADADALITARNFRSRPNMAAVLRSLPTVSEGVRQRALEQVGRTQEPQKPFHLLSPMEQTALYQRERSAHTMAVWGLQRAERERERDYSFEQRQAELRALSKDSTH